MIAHLSYVMCNLCGDPAEPGDNAREARINAERQGYARRDNLDLCRRCKVSPPSSERAL